MKKLFSFFILSKKIYLFYHNFILPTKKSCRSGYLEHFVEYSFNSQKLYILIFADEVYK